MEDFEMWVKALEDWVQLTVNMTVENLFDLLKPAHEYAEVLVENVAQAVAKALKSQLESLTEKQDKWKAQKAWKNLSLGLQGPPQG